MSDEEIEEYKKFRTGFTFKEIRQMLWSYSSNPRDWKHITRHTVLGKWHEIKLEMWNQYKPDKFRNNNYPW